MDILNELRECMQRGDDAKTAELTQQAIDANMTASQILNEGLLSGMAIIGKKMGAHEIFLPEVLLAARAMSAGVGLLKPLMMAEDVQSAGKVVLGTMKGDMHDIGKNLVGIMLEGAGFEIVDLGTDVPPERFVEAAEKEKASVIGMSALLTTTMTEMKKVVDLLESKGMRGDVKVIVGGAPLSQNFADEIGADAYGYDANVAVGLVKEFVGAA
jgi:5-methyltetrahydrofolate--homocysteine methyltransferase